MVLRCYFRDKGSFRCVKVVFSDLSIYLTGIFGVQKLLCFTDSGLICSSILFDCR